MRKSLFGRVQCISIVAVLLLPLLGNVSKTIYAEGSPTVATSDKQITPKSDSTTLPFSSPSPSFGEEFLNSKEPYIQPRETNCAIENCIAITFDDGPNHQYTPHILDLFSEYDARASFFVIGSRVQLHPDLIRRMYREGHDIGNHTWSHPMLDRISPDQITHEFNATQQAIIQTGVPAPLLFRPPYGIRTQVAISLVPAPYVLWNVDPKDWQQKDPHAIAQHVITHSYNGSVIVLHDTSHSTVEAMKRALPELQKRFKLVTVRDMFDMTIESRGQYFGLQ
jgi:peptidoglycan/xylan/chitin deacetylase (PgdA/CDA1 family)